MDDHILACGTLERHEPDARTTFECANPILAVGDLARSVRYYVDILGFTNADWGGTDFTLVSRDGAGIYLAEGGQGNPGTWVWVGVEDVAALYSEYSASGATILEAPRNFPWAYEMKVGDPDGHVLRVGSEPREDLARRPTNISSPMRKQYYFRQSSAGLLAWDVDRLVNLTHEFAVQAVPLADIRELDEPVFGEDEAPTWRSFAAHCRLVQEATLSYAIIRAADGAVMDGMHRVTKALVEGRETINAVQFAADPVPDYVGCRPDELPYELPPNER